MNMNPMECRSDSGLLNDIIFQILIRLPVKTLLRFCCVCKSWQNLITTNQFFIKSHLQIQNQAPTRKFLMYSWVPLHWACDCAQISYDLETPTRYVSSGDHRDSDKTFSYLGIKMDLVGSCDGLLCIYQGCGCLRDSRIYVWNPAFRQCTVLPRSICKGQRTIVLGFGHDPVTDDYKVVKVYRIQVVPEGFISYKVGIYSLKTHSWKSIAFDAIPSAPNYILRWDYVGVVHGRFLYWISGKDDKGCLWLNAFDMARENFQVILVPRYVNIDPSRISLRLFKGRLSISGYTRDASGIRWSDFELWVMKEEYGGGGRHVNENKYYYSWEKQFVLSQKLVVDCIYSTTDVTPCGKILGFCRDKSEVRFAGELGGRMVLYDPDRRIVENVIDGKVFYYEYPCTSERRYKYFVVDNYVETLVSVVIAARGKKISIQHHKDEVSVITTSGNNISMQHEREEDHRNKKKGPSKRLFGLPSVGLRNFCFNISS